MKIDIQDIKFWMDAIRNSEDRDRTLESFWGGQLQSKTWLIENLEKKSRIANASIIIFGGWNGVLASMLFNSQIGVKHITSVDIDPACEEIARTMNKRQEIEGNFVATTDDMCEFVYDTIPDIIINTSCEHITNDQYKKWLHNIPNGSKIVLQSNDYKELDEHINCVSSLSEFKKRSGLSSFMVEEELQLQKYKRFMLIGHK
jgi:predicted RNA methylase